MIKFEPSPKTTRKNWTWSTRRKKQKNQDIKKLKFYWINGGHQCGNCRGFHWHIRSSKNVYRSMECKCHCHLRWSMFKDRSPIEHLLEFPPEKCKCIVCRYMLNKKKIIKIEEFF